MCPHPQINLITHIQYLPDSCVARTCDRKLIDIPSLRRLADEVWAGAADEIVRFLDIAVSERPFEL